MPWNLYASHPWYALALSFVVVFGACSFPVLFFVSAPYGRHQRPGWGPSLPAKVAWVLMEAPASLGFALVFALFWNRVDLAPLLLFFLWQAHYVERAFVFPLRMRGAGKKPAVVTALGILFNVCNGPMNAYAITALAPHLGPAWLTDPRFVFGSLVFALGFAGNRWSDAILRGLRKPGSSGYVVPQGGLFRYVTAPNYLTEIVAWTGFAIAAWTPAAWAFAAFSAANLVPRAISHHRWYRETFPDYPKSRRAIVPFLL
jgi:3-oxo-5-alpha-steroid 4-dehydrogenase 1